MGNKEFIERHRSKVKNAGLLLILSGGIMAYFYYGIEPYETISGFLCGIGLGIFLISFAIKTSKT